LESPFRGNTRTPKAKAVPPAISLSPAEILLARQVRGVRSTNPFT